MVYQFCIRTAIAVYVCPLAFHSLPYATRSSQQEDHSYAAMSRLQIERYCSVLCIPQTQTLKLQSADINRATWNPRVSHAMRMFLQIDWLEKS